MQKRNHSVVTLVLCGGALAGIAAGQTPKSADVEHVLSVQPFTHVASLPAEVDPATIHFEKVRKISVATEVKYVTNDRECAERMFRDPDGSTCTGSAEKQNFVPAYEVTYSYMGPKDMYGSRYSTFEVYFRQDEMAAALRDKLEGRKLNSAQAAEYFKMNAVREPLRVVEFDSEKSSLCAGNYVDGSWVQTDSTCRDKIAYRTVVKPAFSLSVRVDVNAAGNIVAATRAGK
jgi:hypothetical protein